MKKLLLLILTLSPLALDAFFGLSIGGGPRGRRRGVSFSIGSPRSPYYDPWYGYSYYGYRGRPYRRWWW